MGLLFAHHLDECLCSAIEVVPQLCCSVRVTVYVYFD